MDSKLTACWTLFSVLCTPIAFSPLEGSFFLQFNCRFLLQSESATRSNDQLGDTSQKYRQTNEPLQENQLFPAKKFP